MWVRGTVHRYCIVRGRSCPPCAGVDGLGPESRGPAGTGVLVHAGQRLCCESLCRCGPSSTQGTKRDAGQAVTAHCSTGYGCAAALATGHVFAASFTRLVSTVCSHLVLQIAYKNNTKRLAILVSKQVGWWGSSRCRRSGVRGKTALTHAHVRVLWPARFNPLCTFAGALTGCSK